MFKAIIFYIFFLVYLSASSQSDSTKRVTYKPITFQVGLNHQTILMNIFNFKYLTYYPFIPYAQDMAIPGYGILTGIKYRRKNMQVQYTSIWRRDEVFLEPRDKFEFTSNQKISVEHINKKGRYVGLGYSLINFGKKKWYDDYYNGRKLINAQTPSVFLKLGTPIRKTNIHIAGAVDLLYKGTADHWWGKLLSYHIDLYYNFKFKKKI